MEYAVTRFNVLDNSLFIRHFIFISENLALIRLYELVWPSPKAPGGGPSLSSRNLLYYNLLKDAPVQIHVIQSTRQSTRQYIYYKINILFVDGK